MGLGFLSFSIDHSFSWHGWQRLEREHESPNSHLHRFHPDHWRLGVFGIAAYSVKQMLVKAEQRIEPVDVRA